MWFGGGGFLLVLEITLRGFGVMPLYYSDSRYQYTLRFELNGGSIL